jgi:hypothetical protein
MGSSKREAAADAPADAPAKPSAATTAPAGQAAAAPAAPVADMPSAAESLGIADLSDPQDAPPTAAGRSQLAPVARNWSEYRVQAATLMVASNPSLTYMGRVDEPLLAIPVIQVDLNADGSIQKIEVLRQPSQAKDTTQIAIDAIKRAAPFGDVSKLPPPWKLVEVFLFNDDRRFKPRTLDQ